MVKSANINMLMYIFYSLLFCQPNHAWLSYSFVLVNMCLQFYISDVLAHNRPNITDYKIHVNPIHNKYTVLEKSV